MTKVFKGFFNFVLYFFVKVSRMQGMSQLYEWNLHDIVYQVNDQCLQEHAYAEKYAVNIFILPLVLIHKRACFRNLDNFMSKHDNENKRNTEENIIHNFSFKLSIFSVLVGHTTDFHTFFKTEIVKKCW